MSDHQSNNNNNNQHQPPNSTTVARACPIESTTSSIPQISNEIPFLVTHYLRHFNSNNNEGGNSNNNDNIDPATVERIHELSKELSDLFTSIGAFGTSIGNDNSRQNSSFSLITAPSSLPSQQQPSGVRNATYNDILRRWPHLPPSQLPNILLSSVSISTSTLTSKRPDPYSILDAAHESTATDGHSTDSSSPSLPLTLSLLQPPILLSPPPPPPTSTTTQPTLTSSSTHTPLPTTLGSDLTHHLLTAVHHSRQHLENRILLSNSQSLLNSIQQSLSHNYTQRSLLPPIPPSSIIDVDEPPALLALRQRHHDISRVVSHLERQLSQHTLSHTSLYHQTALSKQSATRTFQTATTLHNSFLDPTTTTSCRLLFTPSSRLHTPLPLSSGGYLTSTPTPPAHRRPTLWYTLQSRQSGLTIPLHRPSLFGTAPFSTPYRREASLRPLISHRLRHAVTINCHLTYPVYCLRFDRTGRYFVTGADDHLVKLFKLEEMRRRGAVLVCTLRGHAGVVTDIDISSDNALLASASEDGDCRIWGLKDGCPVAILRGHEGGANMVSWSLLTPYRIVTSAQDGLARVWDVRDAALKRYPRIIGHRRDYRAVAKATPQRLSDETEDDDIKEPEPEPPVAAAAAVPPLPSADDAPQPLEETISVPPLPLPNNPPQPPVIPPLPPGAEPAPIGNFSPGRLIDQGVTLLSQLPHGDIIPSHSDTNNGIGTRARRKAVKVMCVARCPMGGHFCTGSDDGMGRVWSDEIDARIEMLDEELREVDVFGSHPKMAVGGPKTSRRGGSGSMADVTPSKESLMAMLPGHLNAITDVQYSHLGDRILTASEKDGQVRIWKWDRDWDGSSSPKKSKSAKLVNLTQILIRLQPPQDNTPTPATQTTPSRRRRRGGAGSRSSLSPTTVRCDVAVWTCDDSKIITSQSSPLSNTTNARSNPPGQQAQQPPIASEIVIGSNIIYVWNSYTGRCLLGITAAHELCCPVLAPHPLDPCLLASGGADGRLHVWDLNRGGVAVLSHKNTLNHGAMEVDGVGIRRGKDCGYLDGCFSADGWTLVMTDDHGRVTVVDTRSSGVVEGWMQEQYFANDYYDLFYDAHGYAIDRGSELPPHLAPRAARCNHTASSVSEEINRLFCGVSGPSPLEESEVRWKREGIRGVARDQREKMIRFKQSKKKKKGGHQMTVITGGHGDGAIVTRADRPSLDSRDDAARQQERIQQANQRRLNNNYRWIGYDEINLYEIDDDDNDDGDDDAYEEEPRRLVDDEEDEDETEDYSEDNESTPRQQRTTNRAARRRRRRNNNNRATNRTTSTNHSPPTRSTRNERRTTAIAASLNQPTRISSRPTRQSRTYYDPGSSDSDDPFNEEISRVTEPTERMPHRDDYHLKGHFFKLPTNADVHRAWVTRSESYTGWSGTKSYSPQVGDSVVYIPRAHYDSLHKFPTGDQTTAPWKTFPEGTTWPVVKCRVTSIRYRFPYANYYRCSRGTPHCKSIVAIVELEVTGIPCVETDEGGYPWATPRFVERRELRGGSVRFEVSVFENEEVEFLSPEHLYVWRLMSLEESLRKRGRLQVREERGEVELLAFFRSEDGAAEEEEDFSLSPTPCTILGYGDEVMRRYGMGNIALTENIMSEIQVLKSGYNAIEVLWSDDPDDKGTISTWEVTTKEAAERGMPPPPTIPPSEKADLSHILDQLEALPDVKEWFLTPVDTKRYSDYLQMIEVPMHLSFIRERLRNDYYTSTAGLEADIELIRLNCIKYNDDGEVVDAADELVLRFKSLLEKLQERRQRSRSRGHSVDDEAMVMTDTGRGETSNKKNDDEEEEREEAAVHNTRSSARLASRTTEREVSSSSDPHSSASNGSRNRAVGLMSLPAPAPPPPNAAAAAARHANRIEADNNAAPTRTSTRLSSRIASFLMADNDSSGGDHQLSTLEELPHPPLNTTATAATAAHSTQIRISEESDDEPSPRSSSRVTRASAAVKSTTTLYSTDDDDDEHMNDSEKEDLENIDNDSYKEEDDDDGYCPSPQQPTANHYSSSPSRPPQGTSRRTRRSSSTVDSNDVERKPVAAAAVSSRIQTRRSAAAIQEPSDDDDEHADDDIPLLTQHKTQTRRSASAIQDPSEDDDDYDDPPPTLKKPQTTTRQTSTRTRRKVKAHDDDSDSYEEEDDDELASDDSSANSRLGLDEDSDVASMNSIQESRRQVRPKTTTVATATRSSPRNMATTTTVATATRTSPRNKNRPRKRRGYDDDSDDEFVDEDEYISEDDDELDEFVKTPPFRRNTKTRNNNTRKRKPAAAAAAAPAKKTNRGKKKGGRKKAARRKIYSDEEDDDDDDGQMSASSEEYKPPPPKKRKAPNQRTKKGKPTEDHLYLPDVPVWPNVCEERDELVVLAHIIMEKMSAVDVDNLFAEPVVMQYPDISDSYLSKIAVPMDFRTIREERIQDYNVINELQEDLILVFKNCCAYNGEKSKYWQYAVDKWKYLTDCFKEACAEEGVQLPRRW